jgi:hypothetical protein
MSALRADFSRDREKSGLKLCLKAGRLGRKIERAMFLFYIGQFVFYALVAFAMFGLEQGLNSPKRRRSKADERMTDNK